MRARSDAMGSHEHQTASAQVPITPTCAGNAGSTLALPEPSPSANRSSRSPLPCNTIVAAVACRWECNNEEETPMLSCPYTMP
eukprot:9348564-Karenia_brevis.AAC.1